MNDTIYASLAGAREKLIRDTVRLEEEIIESESIVTKRTLLNILGGAYIKIGEISQQMKELEQQPREQKKTFWQKLFNR